MAKNNYIDNNKMLQAFIEYRKQCDEAAANNLPKPELPTYIAECFYLLAERVGSRLNFSSYTYLDEMKEDGIESCIIGADNFDPNKTVNPFGYFTKAIWFAFLRRIEKEKKQNYIKFKLKQNFLISTDENISVNTADDMKVMDTVISDFEDSVRRKKNKIAADNLETKKNGTRLIRKKKPVKIENDQETEIKKKNTSNDLIAEFLSRGGKIKYLPTGMRSSNLDDIIEELEETPLEEVDDLISSDIANDEYGEETGDDY